MSTTRANYVYKSDVPKSIQRQIQQLHEQETRIAELEVELSQLRNAHAELERDLAPYRVEPPFVNIASTQRTPLEPSQVEIPPIHRCPNEILCLIFEGYLVIPLYHHQICFLLLVCRRWYTLVKNTAKLWARIDIFSLDLFDMGSRKSLFPYIFACLNRSKNLPLTVELDMHDLSHGDYITAQLTQHARTIVDEYEHDEIIDQIRHQNWEFNSPLFENQLESIIERLIGVDGEHIKRWETMRLYLPNDADMAIRLWNVLAGGLKAVQNVLVDNFPSAPPDMFMPDFRFVKNFSLTPAEEAERPPMTRFGLSPSTLEHLNFEVGNPNIDLVQISHFQQLRTLELCICLNDAGNLGESLDFSLSLPHLESLTLSGDYEVLAQLRCDFPSLDFLKASVWKINRPLPAIRPRHIQWSIQIQNPIKRKKVIRDFILLSNALERITIMLSERDEVKEIIAQIKLEGKALSLTQIIVERWVAEEGKGWTEVGRIQV